jgi:hypothetical protein
LNGRKTRVFRQERVHDFAWVADPDFARYEEVFGPEDAASDPVVPLVAEQLGRPLEDFALPKTKIVLLLRPEHDTERQRERHFEAVRCALRFFGLRYGPYPYGTITAVDPGMDALGRSLGGGMEYPMLITCGTELLPHRRDLTPEGVTVHEAGHQWWYGLSANNEFEEAWLDEGINTYSEGRAQWLRYAQTMWPTSTTAFGELRLSGTAGPLLQPVALSSPLLLPIAADLAPEVVAAAAEHGFKATLVPDSPLLELLRLQPMVTLFRDAPWVDAWYDRDRWLAADNPDPMVLPAWEFLSDASYGVNSYHRPATLLRTIERKVGRAKWWTFLRRFHERARFGHPTSGDFQALLGEVCGSDAAEFFDQATRAQARFDYGVHSVHPPDGSGPRVDVVIRRYGTVMSDVQVAFRFAAREQPVYRTWFKSDLRPTRRFTFDESAEAEPLGQLLEVWVDPPGGTPKTSEPFELDGQPAGVYLIDENLLNNGWRARRDHKPALYRAVRLLLQAQAQLSFAGLIG